MKGTNGRIGWSLLAATMLAFTVSSTAAAQGATSPVAFGVMAGASIPVGDFGNTGGIGWHAGGLVDWNSPVFPLGIRGDLAYHQFGSKNNFTPKLIVGTLNLVWNFPMDAGSAARPYIIGGGGFYNERGSCTNCGNAKISSQTKFGINGGAGVSFPLSGFSSLIEARYHLIFDSVPGSSKSSFIPISFAILFR